MSIIYRTTIWQLTVFTMTEYPNILWGKKNLLPPQKVTIWRTIYNMRIFINHSIIMTQIFNTFSKINKGTSMYPNSIQVFSGKKRLRVYLCMRLLNHLSILWQATRKLAVNIFWNSPVAGMHSAVKQKHKLQIVYHISIKKWLRNFYTRINMLQNKCRYGSKID